MSRMSKEVDIGDTDFPFFESFELVLLKRVSGYICREGKNWEEVSG